MNVRVTALLAVAVVSLVVAAARTNAVIAQAAAPVQLAVRRPEDAQPPPRCPLPAALRPAFDAASRDTELPTALLLAVARTESSLRVDAVSDAGARGLLQLLPSTAAGLSLDPDDPAQNVLAGARYLRQMLDRFHSVDLALAAYNAGPTAVDRAGGVPNAESSVYVQEVNATWRALGGCDD